MNAFLPRTASALLLLGLVAGCNDRMGSGSGRAGLPTSGTSTPQPPEQRSGPLPAGNSTNSSITPNTR
ncbi:hypothetical protein ACFQX4_05325 [Roseomonas sp. GCM10028921]